MNQAKKGLIFILDGLGDRPHPALDGCTPLEAALTPNLDKLIRQGQGGMMDPLLPGLPVDTHTGVGMLFGLPPKDAMRLARGPIEAAGIGLDMKPGDLLFRANLASIERHSDHYQILDRRAGRISEEVADLCRALGDIEVGDQIVASLHPATQHRCVLKLSGPMLSDKVTDTDPGGKSSYMALLPCTPLVSSNSSEEEIAWRTRSADAVNHFIRVSHEVLDQHPVNHQRLANAQFAGNGVLLRGSGFYQNHRNLLSHLGLKTAVIAAESTILGLGNWFSFNCITEPTMTALTDTNVELKLDLAKAALADHDLVYVHLKGTDVAAHDCLPKEKAYFIERFDQALGDILDDSLVVGVCADHSTDSIRGEHNGDAVPILISHQYSRIDDVIEYNERACIRGGLNRLTAQSFLTTMLDAMGRLSNFSPKNMDYF